MSTVNHAFLALAIILCSLLGCTKGSDRGLSARSSNAIKLKEMGDLMLFDLMDRGGAIFSSAEFITTLSNRVVTTVAKASWRDGSVGEVVVNADTKLWESACRIAKSTTQATNWLVLLSFRDEHDVPDQLALRADRSVKVQQPPLVFRDDSVGRITFKVAR